MNKEDILRQQAQAIEKLIDRIIQISEGKLNLQQAGQLLKMVIDECETGTVKELLAQMIVNDTKLNKEKASLIIEEITQTSEQDTYRPFQQKKLEDLYNKLKKE